jgi:hypothetical protein
MRPSTVNHIVKVGNVILTERGKPSRRPIRLSFSQRTLNAVRKFIYWRHDGPCVTDDWVWYIDAVLPLLVQVSKEKGHPPGWVRQMADEIFPRMDCCPEWWDEQIEEASKPVGIKVDTIAKRLGIKEIELDRCFGPNRRKRGGIVSMDRPKRIRAKERKEEKVLQRFSRRGGQPHRLTVEKEKPWCLFGISRRTYYRGMKEGTLYRSIRAYEKENNLLPYGQAGTTLTPNTLTICLEKNSSVSCAVSAISPSQKKELA